MPPTDDDYDVRHRRNPETRNAEHGSQRMLLSYATHASRRKVRGIAEHLELCRTLDSRSAPTFMKAARVVNSRDARVYYYCSGRLRTLVTCSADRQVFLDRRKCGTDRTAGIRDVNPQLHTT